VISKTKSQAHVWKVSDMSLGTYTTNDKPTLVLSNTIHKLVPEMCISCGGANVVLKTLLCLRHYNIISVSELKDGSNIRCVECCLWFRDVTAHGEGILNYFFLSVRRNAISPVTVTAAKRLVSK
jgi:hypothetical protein